jgi:hypothetical protein
MSMVSQAVDIDIFIGPRYGRQCMPGILKVAARNVEDVALRVSESPHRKRKGVTGRPVHATEGKWRALFLSLRWVMRDVKCV